MTARDAFAMVLARTRAGEAAEPSAVWPVRAKSSLLQWQAHILSWANARREAILRARRARRMRVVESISLGERRSVTLVRVDHREFLIGTSAAGVAMLSELKKPEAGE